MIKLDVKLEKEGAVATLDRLGIESKWLGRNILNGFASLGRKWVRGKMGAFLHTRTGDLKAHVYGKVRENNRAVVSTSRGYRAEILERGGTIAAKKSAFLTFRTDAGGWVKVKKVTIPAKRWFTKSIEGLESSPEYAAVIDKQLEKAIARATR